jgi:hypothetical protein
MESNLPREVSRVSAFVDEALEDDDLVIADDEVNKRRKFLSCDRKLREEGGWGEGQTSGVTSCESQIAQTIW